MDNGSYSNNNYNLGLLAKGKLALVTLATTAALAGLPAIASAAERPFGIQDYYTSSSRGVNYAIESNERRAIKEVIKSLRRGKPKSLESVVAKAEPKSTAAEEPADYLLLSNRYKVGDVDSVWGDILLGKYTIDDMIRLNEKGLLDWYEIPAGAVARYPGAIIIGVPSSLYASADALIEIHKEFNRQIEENNKDDPFSLYAGKFFNNSGILPVIDGIFNKLPKAIWWSVKKHPIQTAVDGVVTGFLLKNYVLKGEDAKAGAATNCQFTGFFTGRCLPDPNPPVGGGFFP